MTSESRRGKPEELPDTILEAAAIWHARLREPDSDPAAAASQRAQFDQWMATDPCHARAFEETKSLWNALEAPVKQVINQKPALTRREPSGFGAFPRGPAVLAACLVIVMMTGVIYRNDVMIRLNSDHMTSVGERTPLTLADGSRVTLNTDSAISVNLETDERLVRLLRGEAWFDVSPDGDRPFFVEMTEGNIRVTGTSFGVRLEGDGAIVSLTEGQLELSAKPDHGVASYLALNAGQQAYLSDRAISDPITLDKTAAKAWLRGQLVFFNTPLREVIAELNRYRGGHIVIVDSRLDDLKVSGVFVTDDPDAALGVIADTLPVRVTRMTDFLVLLR